MKPIAKINARSVVVEISCRGGVWRANCVNALGMGMNPDPWRAIANALRGWNYWRPDGLRDQRDAALISKTTGDNHE